jgi:hypothetical protein
MDVSLTRLLWGLDISYVVWELRIGDMVIGK